MAASRFDYGSIGQHPIGDQSGRQTKHLIEYTYGRSSEMQVMEILILIEPVLGNGYRARGGPLLDLSADGSTREEALAKLREQLEARMSAGAAIVPLQVPAQHPWAQFAGMFKDDPDFQDVVDIIAENRRAMDADPNIP